MYRHYSHLLLCRKSSRQPTTLRSHSSLILVPCPHMHPIRPLCSSWAAPCPRIWFRMIDQTELYMVVKVAKRLLPKLNPARKVKVK